MKTQFKTETDLANNSVLIAVKKFNFLIFLVLILSKNIFIMWKLLSSCMKGKNDFRLLCRSSNLISKRKRSITSQYRGA